MKKLIVLVAFTFILTSCKMFANTQIVSVQCDHYKMSLENNYAYTLNVKIMRGNNVLRQSIFLEPNAPAAIIEGRFTKNNLQNTRIICQYDERTYEMDRIRFENKWNYTLKALSDKKNEDLHISERDFYYKLTAEAASNVTTNYNDNWLEKVLKWVVRNGGRAVKMVYTFKETFQSLSTKRYNSYSAFFTELAKEKIQDKFISKFSNLLEREGILKAETNEYIINSILYCIQEQSDIEEKYEEAVTKAKNEHNRVISEMNNLKSNQHFKQLNTYNAYGIARIINNLKTKTPNFIISVDPLVKGNNLNPFWAATPDRLFEPNNSDELEWSDGVINKSLGGSFGFVVAPEMKLGNNTYSKLYATVGYHQFSYALDTTYRLSRNFFGTTPINARGFAVSEPLQFEQKNITAGLTWRFFFDKAFIFDVNGGYIKQSGVLNLSQSKLSDGYTWAQQKIKIVNDTYIPFGGLKLGYGHNGKHSGYHFTVGADFYKPNQVNSTAYKISELSADKVISFGSDKLHYKINIGLSLAF